MKLQDVTVRVRQHFRENQTQFGKRIGATQTKVSRMEKAGSKDELEKTWQSYLQLIELAESIGMNAFDPPSDDAAKDGDIEHALKRAITDFAGDESTKKKRPKKATSGSVPPRRNARGQEQR